MDMGNNPEPPDSEPLSCITKREIVITGGHSHYTQIDEVVRLL